MSIRLLSIVVKLDTLPKCLCCVLKSDNKYLLGTDIQYLRKPQLRIYKM